MLINVNMDLNELMQRMGSEASEAEAIVMRELLVCEFRGRDTQDISSKKWAALCSLSIV